jgi:hypothetical protein
MQPQCTPPPRVAYLVEEAARIVGKSSTWVRKKRAIRALEAAMIDGRSAVTAASLHALLARRAVRERRPVPLAASPSGSSNAKRLPYDAGPSHLRLVVDSTA